LKNLLFSITLLFLLANTTSSQSGFDAFLASEYKNPFYKHAHLGVSVRDGKTGQVVARFNDHKWMVPASSLKVITTLSALTLLGKDYRFETKIYADGHIDNTGVLHGNLWIKGGGDPTLGSEKIKGNPGLEKILSRITEAVQQNGIREINGNIIADESIFPASPLAPSWQWNDIGSYYGGGAWGINVSENEYSVYFQRDKNIGSPADIQYVEPYIPGLILDNKVTVDKEDSGDNAYIFEGPRQYQKWVQGTVPKGKGLFKIRGAMPDPPLFFAWRIEETLRKAGIESLGAKTTSAPSEYDTTRLLVTFFSPALETIILEANKESNNLYCEAILRMCGHVINGKGTRWSGITTLKDFFTSQGLPSEDISMEDGSGLSSRNLVSADYLTLFLQKMISLHGEKYISGLLPKAGQEGTVKSLTVDPKAQGKIRAKSGSINRAYSLTGICITSQGKTVTFSIMVNGSGAGENRENRRQVEKIMNAIHNFF
jgi:D-alanyl-D-alanine carboxypeptidase/D-alanyl-D-alanine-endopeptidase (penicillin-binding protein 4)